MTRGAKKLYWALGILGAAAVGGTTIYLVTRPKQPKMVPPVQPSQPPLTWGGGGGGGGGGGYVPAFPTTLTPESIYAAVGPLVSWVPAPTPPNGGIITATGI